MLKDNLKRNKNTASSLDNITENILAAKPIVKVNEEDIYKRTSLRLPHEWHDKLKFDLSKKYKKTMHELIMSALEQTYPELLKKDE